MPRILPKFQKDIEKALKDSYESATKASMDASFSEDTSAKENIEAIAKETAKVFSKELAPKLAKLIDAYITSQTFVPVLVSPVGPVTGTITST